MHSRWRFLIRYVNTCLYVRKSECCEYCPTFFADVGHHNPTLALRLVVIVLGTVDVTLLLVPLAFLPEMWTNSTYIATVVI